MLVWQANHLALSDDTEMNSIDSVGKLMVPAPAALVARVEQAKISIKQREESEEAMRKLLRTFGAQEGVMLPAQSGSTGFRRADSDVEVLLTVNARLTSSRRG
jgi:hypothetical protein